MPLLLSPVHDSFTTSCYNTTKDVWYMTDGLCWRVTGNTTVILPEQQTESKQFASWKIGLAVVGGLAGLLLIAILTFLLLKRRRQKQLLALKVGRNLCLAAQCSDAYLLCEVL